MTSPFSAAVSRTCRLPSRRPSRRSARESGLAGVTRCSASADHQPSTYANIRGATIVASDSIM